MSPMFRPCYARSRTRSSIRNGPSLPVAALRPARYREFVTDRVAERYPGQQFGLPEGGSRSVAGIGRRLGALTIDWLLCTAIALSAFHQQYWTIVIFAAEAYLLTATTGFTIGKRLLGARVVRLDGKPVGFIWALWRVLLLLAVVPPLVFDEDLRGLHDRAARTIVIRI
jgi:RDD family